MDETGTYGQFGQAIYDRDERNWHFQRSVRVPTTLRLLGAGRFIAGSRPPVPAKTLLKGRQDGSGRHRENQTIALVKAHPELQPAFGLLPDLARVSEAVEGSASRHEPTKGNLLAFGVITDELAKRQVEVVAFPIGPTGSDLLVKSVRKQRRGWHDYVRTHLQVPTIHGEEAVWKGPGVPIQSIIFARSLEGLSSFLAVRLIRQTLIFRPMLRKEQVSGSSRLDLNLLHSFSFNQTGDVPHADVAFNFWYPRQFAILDQAGGWTIWELSGDRSHVATKLCAAKPIGEQTKPKQTDLKDCWGRVSWIYSPSTIIVCNRRSVTILDISLPDPIEIQRLDFGLDDFGWVLDMKIIPSKPNHVVALTSQYVIVCHIVTTGVTVVGNKMVRVRHFLNPDDISLRADYFSDGDDNLVFLCSDLDPTILIFRVCFAGEDGATIADAVEFYFPLRSPVGSSRLCALDLSAVVRKGDFEDGPSDPLSNGDLQATRFFQLTTLHEDFSVKQTLCVICASNNLSLQLGLPTWERELMKSTHKVLDDDFIVDDEDFDELHPESPPFEPVSDFFMRFKNPQIPGAFDWTINYEQIVRRLNDVDVADVTVIDEINESAQSILRRGNLDDVLPFRTLKEMAEGEVTMQDLESSTETLRKLLESWVSSKTKEIGDDHKTDMEGVSMALQPISLPPILEITDASVFDRLRAMYNTIAGIWNQRESDGITDITRHSRAQIAGRIALEATLSSLLIRPQLGEIDQRLRADSKTHVQSQVWELPVRAGAPPSSRPTPSMSREASSQSRSPLLPTPSESGSSLNATGTGLAIERLNRYTNFTGNFSSRPLSRRLNRVLSHWAIGSTPTTYDWASAFRHFSHLDEEDVEGVEMTEKERSRLQRRTERYVRRRQREAEETQRMQLLSSQAPEIVSGSQPARLGSSTKQHVIMGGSSPSQDQARFQEPVVASQILPGRHGGRPPAKKKKRKSGF